MCSNETALALHFIEKCLGKLSDMRARIWSSAFVLFTHCKWNDVTFYVDVITCYGCSSYRATRQFSVSTTFKPCSAVLVLCWLQLWLSVWCTGGTHKVNKRKIKGKDRHGSAVTVQPGSDRVFFLSPPPDHVVPLPCIWIKPTLSLKS